MGRERRVEIRSERKGVERTFDNERGWGRNGVGEIQIRHFRRKWEDAQIKEEGREKGMKDAG